MERYLKAIWDLQQFASEEVFKFLEHNKDEKLKLTWQYVSTLSNEKSQFSSISEHPEWFSGMFIICLVLNCKPTNLYSNSKVATN